MDHQSDVQKQPLQEQQQRLSETQNIIYIQHQPTGYRNPNYSYPHNEESSIADIQPFQTHNATLEQFENQYPFITNGHFSSSNSSTTIIPNSLDINKDKNVQISVRATEYFSQNDGVSEHQGNDAIVQFSSGNFQSVGAQGINYQQPAPYFLQNLGNQYHLNENLVPIYQSSGSSESSDESSVSNTSQMQYSSDSSAISHNQFEFPVPNSNTNQVPHNFHQFHQKDLLDNYMALLHQDSQVPRCDSSKSEAAESTCSSLSSGSTESQLENENVLRLPILINPIMNNNTACNILPYQSNIQNNISMYPASLEQNESNDFSNSFANQTDQNVMRYNNFNATINNQESPVSENINGINNILPSNNQVNNLVVMLPNRLNKSIHNCMQTNQQILQNPSSQVMMNSAKFVIHNSKINQQKIFGLINMANPVVQDKLVASIQVNQLIKGNEAIPKEGCNKNDCISTTSNKINNPNCGLCNCEENRSISSNYKCNDCKSSHPLNHHSHGEVTDNCTSHFQSTSDCSVINSNFIQMNLSVKCVENDNPSAMLLQETSDKSINQSVSDVNSSVVDINNVYLVKNDVRNVIKNNCYKDSSNKSCFNGNPEMNALPVPIGWSRLLVDGTIIYVSPTNVALSSIEQVKMYLQTAGTCKCGLECPVNCDSIFNFNPKVISRTWDITDSEQTRLCNHKRKAPEAPLIRSDKSIKISSKDVPLKKKKKKQGNICGGASVSQLLAQRDRALAAAAAATRWPNRQITNPNIGCENTANNQYQNIQRVKKHPQLHQKNFENNSDVFKRETSPARAADDKDVQLPCVKINNSVREGTVLNINGMNQVLPESNSKELMRPSQINLNAFTNLRPDIRHGLINYSVGYNPCEEDLAQNAVTTPKSEGIVLNSQGVHISPSTVMQRPRSIPPWHQARIGPNKKPIPEASQIYEKVPFTQQPMPPPPMLVYEDWASRKKVKPSKVKKTLHESPQPSFLENPSAYLAQQTALLHSTISRPNFNILPDTRCISELPQNPPQYPLTTSVGVTTLENNSGLFVSSSRTATSSQRNTFAVRPTASRSGDQTSITQSQIRSKDASGKEACILTSVPSTTKENLTNVAFNNHVCSNTNCTECKKNFCQGNEKENNEVQRNTMFIHTNLPKSKFCEKIEWTGLESEESVKVPESINDEENPVTSSTENVSASYKPKTISDLRPIQGGTVSTSNGSPQPQTSPTSSNVFRQEMSPKQTELTSQNPTFGNILISSTNSYVSPSNGLGIKLSQEYDVASFRSRNLEIFRMRDNSSILQNAKAIEVTENHKMASHNIKTAPTDKMLVNNTGTPEEKLKPHPVTSSLDEKEDDQQEICEIKGNHLVRTMASGHTSSSNTLTSVQAGRTQTATVTVNNSSPISPTTLSHFNISNPNPGNIKIAHKANTKSPLERVQNVVSSVQTTTDTTKTDEHSSNSDNVISLNKNVFPSTNPLSNILTSTANVSTAILANNNSNAASMLKTSPGTLQTGHILVAGNIIPQANLSGLKLNQTTSMPPISASPVITSNVTGAVTQVLPAVGVAQQVLGQSTVLVNALPAPFVIQPGVMAVETGLGRLAVASGSVLQGNVIDNNPLRNSVRGAAPLEKIKYKKGTKKRKSQVTPLVQMATPNNVILNQCFGHQNLTVSPSGSVHPLQAVTLVQGKHGQILMNNHNNFNQFNSQPQQINLLQPVNLTSVSNFPAFQQFIVPGLGNMVMSTDGTTAILPETNIGVQLQLQNMNGQNVLTPVQNSFLNSPGILTTPTGMFIRAPNSQQKIVQNNASPQFLSPNNSQFLVNQFQGQLSPLIAANLSPNQQLFTSSPQRQSPQEFIQIIPTSNSQNTTVVQQNTTIVQQQTTMVSNNQNILNNSAKPNIIIGNQTAEKPIELQIVEASQCQSQSSQPAINGQVQQTQQPQRVVAEEKVDFGTQHSVSTQTNVGEETTGVGVTTNNTFCQTLSSNWNGSPPDTTTLSPVESDTNYDRVASSPTEEGPDSFRQAMVQYVSSSINENENEGDSNLMEDMSKVTTPNVNMSRANKKTKNLVESCITLHEGGVQIRIGSHYVSSDNLKSTVDECIVSSHSDVNIEDKHIESQSSITSYHKEKNRLVDALLTENKPDDLGDEGAINSKEKFAEGDLVWGPIRGFPAWPGKLVGPVRPGGKALVRWFGGHSSPTRVNISLLQSLSQGLEAHHRASNKGRKNRKLNLELEAAIQEAMLELDKMTARETKVSGSGRGRPRRFNRCSKRPEDKNESCFLSKRRI